MASRLRTYLLRLGLWLHAWLTARLYVLEAVETDYEYGDLVALRDPSLNIEPVHVVLASNVEAAAVATVPVSQYPDEIVHVWGMRQVQRAPVLPREEEA